MEAVTKVKRKMTEDGFKYNKKLSDKSYSAPNPFSSVQYRPELDTSAECTESHASFYHNLIGVIRWIVELKRIDIAYEVSVLSSYMVAPRTGHLLQALHVFNHLEIHSDNDLAFDSAYQNVSGIDKINFKQSEMKSIYVNAEEDLPPNATTNKRPSSSN